MSLPSGTVTFLFTDIEGSTKLWEAHPEAMRLALERHDTLLRQTIEENGGVVFKTVGDAFCAAFATAPDALQAALASHLLLLTEEWGETGPLRVRMALHTGEAHERHGDYFGPTLNRVARLQAIGHGQQTLLSHSTYQLVCQNLPAEMTLLDMGRHSLKDLLAPEQIWQLQHAALPLTFPSLKSLNYLPTNLPRQMTSFIGRNQEMAEIKRLLPSTPLLTLLGSGGGGKTRLALQVGADVLDNYKEGVWLVELAALSEPNLVSQAVAAALGLREEAGRSLLQTLQDYLRERQLLLLLDNCEHLLIACASLADSLLKTCPHLSILATSREPLGIAGEHPWRVPSLLTPEPDDLPAEEKDLAAVLMEYDACRLFVERVVVQRPDFVLTRRNVPVVAQLCRQLDGIPLALELAAARMRSLSVEEISARLDNRFRLLTGGSRTALPRQQTLRALIDWSYDLLNAQEKTLLERLSVFAGGWTLDAAEQVSSGERAGGENIEDWEVLDLLMSLTDKSLVMATNQGDKMRYRLLETVRRYAHDRLLESREILAVRARHGECFLKLAEEIKPKLKGAEQAGWLAVLEEEHDNLRQALILYEEAEEVHAGERGLRLGAALQYFWQIRGHLSEGRAQMRALLAHPGGQEATSSRAVALNGAGALAWRQGDYVEARVLCEESLLLSRKLGDKANSAWSLNNLGLLAYEQGDHAQARILYEQSLAMRRELGDKWETALSLNNLGLVAHHGGNYVEARVLHEESLGIRREMGDREGIAGSLNNLGILAYEQGDYALARVLHEESLGIRRELIDKRGIALSLGNLALIAHNEGDSAQARVLHAESLTIARELGNRQGIATALNNLGLITFDQGDTAQAQILHQESLTIAKELGDKRRVAISLLNLGNVAYNERDYASARMLYEQCLSVRRELGEKQGIATALSNLACVAFDQGDYAQARVLQEESFTIARELGDKNLISISLYNLGSVACKEGDYASTWIWLEESLMMARELGSRQLMAYNLESFALLAVKEAQEECGIRLWGAASSLRDDIGCPLSPDEREKQERETSGVRQRMGEDAFAAAWAEGRSLAWEQAIEYALEKVRNKQDHL